MKREPTLADRVLVAPVIAGALFRREDLRLRGRLAQAKRYVLDDEATHWLACMVRDLPDAVVEAGEFAIPAHPLMWVEYNSLLMHATVAGDRPGSRPANADLRVGYLFDGPNVFPASCAPMSHDGAKLPGKAISAGFSAVVYRLNQPWTWAQAREETARLGISPAGIDRFFWGSSFTHIDERNARALREQHSVDLIRSDGPIGDDVKARLFYSLAQAGQGDLRKILYVLLALNRTRHLQMVSEVGPARTMIGNKPATLTRHHRITFVLNPEPEIRRIVEGPTGQAWRRRHDVRGHFCHDRTAREASFHGTCSHDWMETGARADRQWGCLRCGGKRWWRAAHQRGHIEKGVVDAHYDVTAKM